MTPPDANLEKQKRRHRPELWGILGAVLLAVAGAILYAYFGVETPDPATGAEGAAPAAETQGDAAD